MKKLMTAFAACMIAGLVSAAVESQNIVGYTTVAASGSFPLYGGTFITVGDTGTTWALGNVSANGMEAGTDNIQFLDPNDLSTTLQATYIDAATAAALGDAGLQGWWDMGIENSLDTETFASGTGFLCNLVSGNPVEFVFNGEVVQDQIAVDMTGLAFPLVANPVPADLTLGQITADGMEAGTDNIQFLDPNDLSTVLQATYIDAATAAALGDAGLQGWWDMGIENSLDTTPVPAGASVLGNFVSGNPVTITFPNPMI